MSWYQWYRFNRVDHGRLLAAWKALGVKVTGSMWLSSGHWTWKRQRRTLLSGPCHGAGKGMPARLLTVTNPSRSRGGKHARKTAI